MDTTLSILCDLIPLALFVVFVGAAAADPLLRFRERLQVEHRQAPRHVARSGA